MTEDDTNNASRREEEFDAIRSFYGDDIINVGEMISSLSSKTKTTTSSQIPPCRSNGPWRIVIASSIILELELPSGYPSRAAPVPKIHAPPFVVDENAVEELEQEMIEMWTEDTEVAILWTEHLKSKFANQTTKNYYMDQADKGDEEANNAAAEIADNSASQDENNSTQQGVRIFHPYTSKYGQPVRQFDAAVVSDVSNRREIYRGSPYHPPKSGPSETLIAHVASVHCMDHVHWVLAELLFNDKKVARATHNMIAYRFWDEDRNCMVSDNDDDGEKGAGAKLAALLEMSDAQNVIVVVSRWFGGVLLGPSRFKYIASTARDALEESGFISTKK